MESVKSVNNRMGELIVDISKLMKSTCPAPRTHCTPSTPCCTCSWRHDCEAYNTDGGRGYRVITITEALNVASDYFWEEDKLPSSSTVYRWAKTGVVSAPVGRENGGKATGMKDLYPVILPLDIAITCRLSELGFSMKRIAEVRQAFVEVKDDGEKLQELISDLDAKDAAAREYVYYYFSLPYYEESQRSYKVLIDVDGQARVNPSKKRMVSMVEPLQAKVAAISSVGAGLSVKKGGKTEA